MEGILALGFSDIIEWIRTNWAMVAAIVVTGSIAFGIYFILPYYVNIVLNIFCDTPPPLLVNLLDYQRIDGEHVQFRSFDGMSLQGIWLNPPKNVKIKGTIIFCHEYGSDMHSAARYTRHLIESGYRVFSFDFRAHGKSKSPGYQLVQWPSDKELCDALGAIAHVRQQLEAEGTSTEIGIFGISRGAGVSLLAAQADPDIKAVMCDGAFCTQTTLISYMKRWVHLFAKIRLVYENHPDFFWRFLCRRVINKAQKKLKRRFPSVRKAVQSLDNQAVFYIHGKRDSYIKVEHSKALHAVTPGNKFLWIVPKAKHNQSVIIQPEQYQARTLAFFDKYLANEPIAEQTINEDKVIQNIA